LSIRLDRYYGRLRRPAGWPSPSRSPGYRTPRSDELRSRRASEDLPSSHRHLPNVPRPLRRGVPGGCTSRVFTASMAFALRDGARLSLDPLARAHSRRGRLRFDATDRLVAPPSQGFGRCASTPGVSPRRRQPATGPPGGYPDRTPTGWRRRASDQVMTATRSPPSPWAHSRPPWNFGGGPRVIRRRHPPWSM
jgi:hypothetical protein